MTFFLLNVSGKALLERRMRKTRPGYDDYVARTSGFFPAHLARNASANRRRNASGSGTFLRPVRNGVSGGLDAHRACA